MTSLPETDTRPLDSISFADRAVQISPFETYDRLREEAPVHHDPITGNYVLTRYADVRAALIDHRRLSSDVGLVGNRMSRIRDRVEEIFRARAVVPGTNIQALDPPEHRMIRQLVDRAFARWNVEAILPRINEVINGLIDEFIDRGRCEFVSEFASRVPMQVIAGQLGLRDETEARVRFWADCAVEAISPVLSEDREIEISEALADLYAFFIRNIDRANAASDATLLSRLTQVMQTPEGKPDYSELLALLQALLVAGYETTAFTFSSGMKLLIEQPDLADQCRASDKKLAGFVEEVLRTRSPVQTLFRRAKEDIEIGGVVIPKGARIEVRYGAANLDPSAFACPATVNIDAPRLKQHLAFGAGIHSCIGSQLARTELMVGFAALLRRLKNFRPAAGEDSYSWTSAYISYGLTKLDMEFDRV